MPYYTTADVGRAGERCCGVLGVDGGLRTLTMADTTLVRSGGWMEQDGGCWGRVGRW